MTSRHAHLQTECQSRHTVVIILPITVTMTAVAMTPIATTITMFVTAMTMHDYISQPSHCCMQRQPESGWPGCMILVLPGMLILMTATQTRPLDNTNWMRCRIASVHLHLSQESLQPATSDCCTETCIIHPGPLETSLQPAFSLCRFDARSRLPARHRLLASRKGYAH